MIFKGQNVKLSSLKKRGRLKIWEWSSRLEERLHELHYLFWEATLECNLRCLHCGSECQPRRQADDSLTQEEVLETFRTISQDYDVDRLTIAITGGEPLVRSDFFEITAGLRQMGFVWGMVTNGTLVTREIADRCKATGMETVAVSLDGLEETHDWLRGQGTFSKAIEAVEIFTKSGDFSTVQITSCITPRSLDELEALHRLCVDLHVDEWRVLTIAPMGRASHHPELFLDGGQLRKLMSFLQECRKKGPSKPKVFYAEEGFLGVEFEGEVRDLLYRCFAGVNIGGILYNGDIAACPNLPRHLAQGNVRKERFSDVWENKYRIFRDRRWSKTGTCRKCEWWGLCRGNSLHLWDWGKMAPRMCHYRMLQDTVSSLSSEVGKSY